MTYRGRHRWAAFIGRDAPWACDRAGCRGRGRRARGHERRLKPLPRTPVVGEFFAAKDPSVGADSATGAGAIQLMCPHRWVWRARRPRERLLRQQQRLHCSVGTDPGNRVVRGDRDHERVCDGVLAPGHRFTAPVGSLSAAPGELSVPSARRPPGREHCHLRRLEERCASARDREGVCDRNGNWSGWKFARHGADTDHRQAGVLGAPPDR